MLQIHAGEGSIHITCTVRNQYAGRRYHGHRTRHSPKNDDAHIRAVRTGKPSGARARGVGIGLALTKNLVEITAAPFRHRSAKMVRGVSLRYHCQLTLWLPQRRAKHPLPHPYPSGRSHLTVDDNIEAALSLQKLLSIKGHTVTVAFDGNSALTRVRESEPDVVLLDIGLPDMTGYEVAAHIREFDSRPFIVALSGLRTRSGPTPLPPCRFRPPPYETCLACRYRTGTARKLTST